MTLVLVHATAFSRLRVLGIMAASASIEVSRDSLVVHAEGADMLWAMKSRLQIPLANVVSAWVIRGTRRAVLRMPG